MTGPSEKIMKKQKIPVSDLTTLGKWNRSTLMDRTQGEREKVNSHRL